MLNRKAIFINTAAQVLVRFITLAFTLVAIKFLTGYIGTAGVGKYNTITTYVNFFVVIADLGLFAVTVREIAKNPADEKKIVSNVFTVRLWSGLAAAVVAFFLIFFTKYRADSDMLWGTALAAGFLFFNLLGSVYDMVLQYRLKMQYSALAEFLAKFLSIIALVAVIYYRGNFLMIAATIALYGIGIFIFKWLFARSFLKFGVVYDRKVAGWILSMSWPLGIVFIVNNLYFKLDTLMLFYIKGASPTGIYSVAYQVLAVTAFIGSYFASALKPTLAENIAEGRQKLAGVIQKSLTVMLFASAPIVIICAVFAKDIILFLSTPAFLSGSTALVILTFTLPFIYFDTLLSEIMIANDERKLLIKVSVFILIFNFICNIILIPRYSFIGAAWGTLVSEILLLVVNIYYTRKIIPYSFDFGNVAKIVLISLLTLIAGLALKLTGLYFLILIVLVAIIYLTFAGIFKISSVASFKALMSKD